MVCVPFNLVGCKPEGLQPIGILPELHSVYRHARVSARCVAVNILYVRLAGKTLLRELKP